jgi:hypothetical protein
MSTITTLASGQITPSDTISIEFVRPDNMPASVKITWPQQSTVYEPRRFPDGAAALVRLFARASTALTQIKASER